MLDLHVHLRLSAESAERLEKLSKRLGLRRQDVLRLLLTREADALDAKAIR